MTTGVEFSIPLSVLNNPTGAGIKITAFINNGGHDFLSNQVSGAGILFGNIGAALPDFDLEFSPNGELQYVTVPTPPAVATGGAVPEPGAATLLALAALRFGVRRRRR